jgi:hypothetical protein
LVCARKTSSIDAAAVLNIPLIRWDVSYQSLTEDSGKLEPFLVLFPAISFDPLRSIQEGKVDTTFFGGRGETGDQMS